MEINLEEAELDSVQPITEPRSLAARKRQYRHKKKNSEIESLFRNQDEEEEEETETEETEEMKEAETTASQFRKGL